MTYRVKRLFLDSQDTKSQRFIDAWLNDVASLEDRDDAEKLEFPDITEV